MCILHGVRYSSSSFLCLLFSSCCSFCFDLSLLIRIHPADDTVNEFTRVTAVVLDTMRYIEEQPNDSSRSKRDRIEVDHVHFEVILLPANGVLGRRMHMEFSSVEYCLRLVGVRKPQVARVNAHRKLARANFDLAVM